MATHRINLHDTYGVEWTDEMIARDLVQNFYDSVPPERFATDISINVDRSSRTATIHGPAKFHIEYLWRIGVTTKQGKPGEFAGEFGEGFVVGVLQILRDSSASVRTRVGNSEARFRLEEVRVGDQTIQELVCDVASVKQFKGSQLIVEGARPSLLQAFEDCRTCFRYPDNPLFGKLLGEDRAKGIYVYRSARASGAILYRRQKRGSYGLPFVFCHDRELKEVKTGRDRLDLSRAEINAIVWKAVGVLGAEVIERLVQRDLAPHWEDGHALLKALSEAWRQKGNGRKIQFPDDYCARYRYGRSWQYEQTARRLEKTICPEYMSLFGMRTTKDIDEDLAKGQTRDPTGVETARFETLRSAFERVMGFPLAGWRTKVFTPTDEKKSVEGVYSDKTIYLTPERLQGSFSEAFAVFLHEALHSSGADGDPRFSDKLTWAIHQLLESRSVIDAFEAKWADVKSDGNRPQSSKKEGEPSVNDRLNLLESRLKMVESRLLGVKRRRRAAEDR